MFGGTITLFTVRGIRVVVDWSWFLVLFLVIFWLSDFYGDLLGPGAGETEPFVLALISAVGFFGSIVLHEFGHAVAALRDGIGINTIRLWIFGGMAQLKKEAETPGSEFQVAIAGPLVTLAVIVVTVGIGVATVGGAEFRDAMELRANATSSGIIAVLAWLASVNILVLLFNLLPAFPMDGGRIARAIAWKLTGKRSAATRFAALLGRGFGLLFIALGLVLALQGYLFTGVWLALIGFLINGSAKAATVQTTITGRLEGVKVSDVMDRSPVAMPADLSIERALEEYFLRYQWSWFPVVDAAGRFRGMMLREDAERVDEVARSTTTVAERLEADQGELHVDERASLETLLGNANLRRFGALMAVDAEGRLSGVVTIEQLGRALRDGA